MTAERRLLAKPPDPLPLGVLCATLSSHYRLGPPRPHAIFGQVTAFDSLLPLIAAVVRRAVALQEKQLALQLLSEGQATPDLAGHTGLPGGPCGGDLRGAWSRRTVRLPVSVWEMLEIVRRAVQCVVRGPADVGQPGDRTEMSLWQTGQVLAALQSASAALLLSPGAGTGSGAAATGEQVPLAAAVAAEGQAKADSPPHTPEGVLIEAQEKRALLVSLGPAPSSLHVATALHLLPSFLEAGRYSLAAYERQYGQAEASRVQLAAGARQEQQRGDRDPVVALIEQLQEALTSALHGITAVACPALAAARQLTQGSGQGQGGRQGHGADPAAIFPQHVVCSLLCTGKLLDLLRGVAACCKEQLLPLAAPLIETLQASSQGRGVGGVHTSRPGAAGPAVPRAAAGDKKAERERKEQERREAAEAEAQLQQQLAAATAALTLLRSLVGCVETLVLLCCENMVAHWRFVDAHVACAAGPGGNTAAAGKAAAAAAEAAAEAAGIRSEAAENAEMHQRRGVTCCR